MVRSTETSHAVSDPVSIGITVADMRLGRMGKYRFDRSPDVTLVPLPTSALLKPIAIIRKEGLAKFYDLDQSEAVALRRATELANLIFSGGGHILRVACCSDRQVRFHLHAS